MGKKKKTSFIDKKNSATFHLLARDTSTPSQSAAISLPPPSDRVFVRVDNNHFNSTTIFSNAPGDTSDEDTFPHPSHTHSPNLIPAEARKEILDLGLPDDGYNYLQHLREISNAGAGTAYYQNSKARMDLMPLDVRAYDASRLRIGGGESSENSVFDVASKAVGARVQRVVDADVARLLDDGDLSRFGSDVEDFEEDFVLRANLPVGDEGESEEVGEDDEVGGKMGAKKAEEEEEEDYDEDSVGELEDGEKPRVHRLLDKQFDLEILDLGLPDDGYNYLQHLREISNAGAGTAYYQNSKARMDLMPLDVRAYDASRLRIGGGESGENSVFDVASKAVGARVQRVVDADVARLLDDGDLSRFGSDVEDFEEDFVLRANLPVGDEGESEEVGEDDEVGRKMGAKKAEEEEEEEEEDYDEDSVGELEDGEKPRVHRLLDKQFDLLALREYGDTSSDDDGYLNEEGETTVAKVHDALKECKVDDFEFEVKYRVPGDYAHKQETLSMGIQLDDSTEVISRCREYAEKYCNEDEDKDELIVVEESSDELEVWDCETIVSTYSNLDNHPCTIGFPEVLKRKLSKSLPVDSIKKTGMIELRGKEKLPLEFLPHVKKEFEKVKKPTGLEIQKSKPRREESKDEKKERKVAVKEERREARRAKKELKDLYRCETHKAQKVAAVSMPSAIHLM